MGISPVVIDILKKRGIEEEEDLKEFLSDKPQLTYDPFLLKDMKEGVDFILSNIEKDKRICIYGDYDVDGITGTALLYNFLSSLTNNIDYYIPSRFEEGYGLNKDALYQLKENGVECVITVDCGAVSKSEVSYAQEIGLDIMITDHHNIEQNSLPKCIVINPKHISSSYPFDGLCGCAVAFKLVQAIVRSKKINRDILKHYLDLVAIATIADVVPLVDENRTLVKYGLKQINRGTNKALRVMCNKLGLELGTVDSYKIGFVIGPHLNAAGRIKDAKAAVKLFTSDNNNEIDSIMDQLIDHNKERRSIQEMCIEESIDIIERKYKDDPFIIVNPQSIHEGIAGIVAGKIKEKYNKPTIVLSQTDIDGKAGLKGSGRSIEGIDLIRMLLKHEDLFEKVGGHAMAAGFSILVDNEEHLRKALFKEMNDLLKIDPELLTLKITNDIDLTDKDVTLKLAKELELLAPYGVGNPKPVVKLTGFFIERYRYLGKEKKHIRFDSNFLECIAFNEAEKYSVHIDSGNSLTLYGNININSWNNRETPQLIIKNIM